MTAMTALTATASVAVLIVLIAGLWNLLRAGNANLSQKLMRWRIGLQFAAIVLAMLALFISNR